MARSLAELELDPMLTDWTPQAEDAQLTDALQPLGGALTGALQPPPEPRKALDVSKGAPATQQPRQDTGGIDALKEAMAQARQNRLGAELGMAGQTIANAFVPQKSTGFWERQLEGADRPVQELQAFQKQRGDEEDRRLKQADREGKSAYTQALQQQIQANIEAKQRESDVATQRADKDSDLTRTWRSAFVQTPEGKTLAEAMGPDFERLTPALIEGSKGASQMLKSLRPAATKAPPEMSPYQAVSTDLARQRLGLQRQKQDQDRLDKAAKREADAEAARLDKQAKSDAEQAKTTGKLKADVTQVETFGQNILRNIDKLEQMVGPGGPGTFEATGPESKIMGALIKEIAVDSAKLADPGSVAREGEVAMEQSKLWDPGSPLSALSLTNKTAKALLTDYRQRVKDRIKTAYEVRGIGGQQAAPSVGPSSKRTPDGNDYDTSATNPKTGERRYFLDGKEVK